MKCKYLFIVFLTFLFNLSLNGQTEKKFIRQGNKDYNRGQYSESELSYRKAIDAGKTSSVAMFNLGDALYKQKKYDEASKKFNENFGSEADKEKKANALYNLGNSLLKSQKIEESINAYKSSLKIDPANMDAKYNLAYAQDLLKKQEEQKQQQKQDQNKDQKDNKQDKNDNKYQQDKNQPNKDNQDNSQQQSQQQQQTISKEDAERLLSALANDENKVQEKVKKDKAEKGMIKILKNW
jgi:Ca-activated chloride channel family protein